MSDDETLQTDRAALVYDVHGNAAALSAVLRDIADRGIETIVGGGDYANAGPRPAAAVRRISSVASAAIRGNTDEWVTGRSEPPEEPPFEHVRERLPAGALDWLDDRPFACRILPDASDDASDALLAVHANPTDITTPLLVEDHTYDDWTSTPEDRAAELLEDVDADLVAFGHIHQPTSGELAGARLTSVGSVGLPWDRDHRAAYGIAQWTGESWEVEDVRIEYDWESVADEVARSGAPDADAVAESLRTATFDPMA